MSTSFIRRPLPLSQPLVRPLSRPVFDLLRSSAIPVQLRGRPGSQDELQCRHLIPALDAWIGRAYYATALPIANSFLATDAWMTSQLNVALTRKLCVSLMYLASSLTYTPFVIVQPGTDRRPVDWCRN